MDIDLGHKRHLREGGKRTVSSLTGARKLDIHWGGNEMKPHSIHKNQLQTAYRTKCEKQNEKALGR